MMRMLQIVIAALSFAYATSALAQPDAEAFALFMAGDYEAAAARAAMMGGAENLALAARALNADAYLEVDDKTSRQISKRALKFAEDAIKADDELVEGRLQAAIALAQRGARMSPLRAFIAGLADRAREELDAALAMAPGNPWALSSSAAWHLEVARRVGEGRFGADSALGLTQFEQARARDPGNILIAYECGLRLLASDKPEWRGAGLACLDAALAAAPQNAFERAMQERAVMLAAAVATGRDAERAFIESQP